MKRKAKSGNRKTHFSKWTDFVKKVYREMKQRNPNAMLRDAMMEASKRKREM
jgi:hypothetical protein